MTDLEKRRLERDGELVTITFRVAPNSPFMDISYDPPEWFTPESLRICCDTLIKRLEEE